MRQLNRKKAVHRHSLPLWSPHAQPSPVWSLGRALLSGHINNYNMAFLFNGSFWTLLQWICNTVGLTSVIWSQRFSFTFTCSRNNPSYLPSLSFCCLPQPLRFIKPMVERTICRTVLP